MNETSLCRTKLVSCLAGERLDLLALAQRAEASCAYIRPHHTIALPDGHTLHIRLPAPLGVALRETDAIAKHWPPLAAEAAPVGHVYYPLTIAGWLARHSGARSPTVDFTMSSPFLQTACHGTR
jgi:hypothetical protein